MDEMAARIVAAWRAYDPYGFDDQYDTEGEGFRAVRDGLMNDPMLAVNHLLGMVEDLIEEYL